jgi:tRNA 2-selenouridine synthase
MYGRRINHNVLKKTPFYSSIMVSSITIEDAVQKDNIQFIDTRTPKEFAEDHLPNAINIPLLSNEERAIVGLLYKQTSREKAIEKGVELFSAKLPRFLSQINKYRNKTMIIHCWRGGMRSSTVTTLLESLGYDVLQLKGGYKEYRRYVRERLAEYKLKPTLVVLWGLTCSGKTELLQQVDNAIDLEGLAQHRGSLFGKIGLLPRSQKLFENMLLQKLESLQDEKFIFIEGESRKIGDVQIPLFLWKKMCNAINISIVRSMDERIACALQIYKGTKENDKELKKIISNLRDKMSKKRKTELIQLIDDKKYEHVAKILLEEYYDPLYKHTLDKHECSYTVENNDVMKAKGKLQKLF